MSVGGGGGAAHPFLPRSHFLHGVVPNPRRTGGAPPRLSRPHCYFCGIRWIEARARSHGKMEGGSESAVASTCRNSGRASPCLLGAAIGCLVRLARGPWECGRKGMCACNPIGLTWALPPSGSSYYCVRQSVLCVKETYTSTFHTHTHRERPCGSGGRVTYASSSYDLPHLYTH